MNFSSKGSGNSAVDMDGVFTHINGILPSDFDQLLEVREFLITRQLTVSKSEVRFKAFRPQRLETPGTVIELVFYIDSCGIILVCIEGDSV